MLQFFTSYSTTGVDKELHQTNSDGIVGTVDHMPKKGMLLPFQPLSLVFDHINYYVDMPAVSSFSLLFQFCTLETLVLANNNN